VLHADIGWIRLENCLGKDGTFVLLLYCTNHNFVMVELSLLIVIDNLFENMILLIYGKNADIIFQIFISSSQVCLS